MKLILWQIIGLGDVFLGSLFITIRKNEMFRLCGHLIYLSLPDAPKPYIIKYIYDWWFYKLFM